LLLIAVAVALHFNCCDWRLPRWDYSPILDEYVCVPYDNALIGFIHAGSAFRTSLGPEGALYDLDSAAWWGIHVPLLLGCAGVLAVAGQCAPQRYKMAVRRRIATVAARYSPWWAAAAPTILLTLFMGSSLVGGTIYVAHTAKPTSVAPTKDTHVADLAAVGGSKAEAAADDKPTGGVLARLASFFSESSPSEHSASSSTWGSSNLYYSSPNTAPVSTPEPSTFALLAVGAFGILAYAWRRRRKQSA
jgi:hypothetical protein